MNKFFLYIKDLLLKLSKSTPSVMIYEETGTTPLHITIEKRMIGYWLQILMGSSSKLNYQIYKYILHLDMQNVYCTQWIRKIKEILQPALQAINLVVSWLTYKVSCLEYRIQP